MDGRKRIKLIGETWASSSVLRLSEGFTGITSEALFSVIDSTENCDYWLGGEDIASYSKELERVNRRYNRGHIRNGIFVYMENPQIWLPSAELLEQFDIVISPVDISCHLNRGQQLHLYPPCVPWFYGNSYRTDVGLKHVRGLTGADIKDLEKMEKPKKTRLLSMITSAKCMTRGHLWRQKLAKALKHDLGDRIDIFGFGWNPVEDKRTAIDKYHFSVVVENEDFPFYITEKVVDALLGWSVPIYAGAKNAPVLLGEDLLRIEFGGDIQQAVQQVKMIVEKYTISDESLGRLRLLAMKRLNPLEAIPKLLDCYTNG